MGNPYGGRLVPLRQKCRGGTFFISVPSGLGSHNQALQDSDASIHCADTPIRDCHADANILTRFLAARRLRVLSQVHWTQCECLI